MMPFAEMPKGAELQHFFAEVFRETRESAVAMASLRTELQQLTTHMRDMLSTVRGGGDKKSVLERLALIEQDIENVKLKLEDAEAQDREERREQKTDSRESRQIRIAIVLGILSLLASIAQFFLK